MSDQEKPQLFPGGDRWELPAMAELTQLRATVQRLEAENTALKNGLEEIWLWLAPGQAEIPDVPRARVNIGGIVMRLTADKRTALESKGEVG